MGQALYRKYRSRTLDEVVGNEHITTTLANALKSGKISHAYLFTGPRGVGKTSIARILAHAVNELDYNGEGTHLDIIEIDAASNRGIDEIRDLREKAHVAPARGKYKVYIIDEVHMLTTPAFNALLKTLEEPPAHVLFILATTEAHKLPETIISRTQRYSFRPVEQAKVVEHLRHIAKQEKIKVDDEALALIAAHGEGTFRDSISLLDQAANHGEAITTETIRGVLGLPPQAVLGQLLNNLASSDSASVMRQLNDLYAQGYQGAVIAKQLSQLGRQLLLDGTSPLSNDQLLDLLRQLIDVAASPAPDRLLEIILLQQLPANGSQATATAAPPPVAAKPAASPPKPATKPKAAAVASPPASQTSAPAAKPAEKPIKASKSVEQPTAKPPADPVATDKLWPALLQAIKQDYNTLYGIMRMAQPNFGEGDELELTFKYAFHQKRMQEPKHRKIIIDHLQQLSGHTYRVTCVHDNQLVGKTPLPPPAEEETVTELAPPADGAALKTISNIFGGGELLES